MPNQQLIISCFVLFDKIINNHFIACMQIWYDETLTVYAFLVLVEPAPSIISNRNRFNMFYNIIICWFWGNKVLNDTFVGNLVPTHHYLDFLSCHCWGWDYHFQQDRVLGMGLEDLLGEFESEWGREYLFV